ncbi:MAG: SusC/RagA family TonB-linked outer membrane protein, partial [Bacilli bacterium]
NFVPYVNFGENAYRGAEVGLSFNHKYKDWEIALGANALYTTSEVKKKNEIYANDYQYRKGHPVDAIFGLEAEGFFTDENDISNHAFQAFGIVKPGDIKYVDQNNDGVVNEDDEVPIGRAQAPFSYGLNLLLSYKNISLFTIGNGQLGADSYINGSYYRTDGDKKYSDYLLGRWTEETKATATYPRLTTMESTNNYHNSTFWLYKDDYFTLQRVQLTYQFPSRIAESLFMKGLNFYFAASNLLTISKYRDIKELRIGSEPNYRSFSLGMKIIF